MTMSAIELRLAAIERYQQSVRQAEIRDFWARISGRRRALLKYEEVAKGLHIRQKAPTGLQMAPLNRIVGSVGRYREFTDSFLPRATVGKDRWVAVDVMMNSFTGLPPVELLKIGEGYFVIDGNHRISVARANGSKDIEAVVTECLTPVHLTLADFRSGHWRIKAAYSDFLSQSQLDKLRPGLKLEVTQPQNYQSLLQHIEVHRYLSNQPRPTVRMTRDGYVLSWTEAVASWYDTVYMPVIEAMRAQGVQRRFAKETETDLYLRITQFREQVAEEYELAPLSAKASVALFAANQSGRVVDRFVLALRRQSGQRLGQLLRWGPAQSRRPAGMIEAEFRALRLRHDAGELGLKEAGRKLAQEARFAAGVCEGQLGIQFSG